MAWQYTLWIVMLFLQGNLQYCDATLGGACSSTNGGTECTVTNAHCVNDICVCEDKFKQDGDKCLKAQGQTCGNTDECVSNSVCDSTCKCSSGFVASEGLCAKVIGSSCTGTGTGDCPGSSNTVCVEQKCACEDGYEEKNNVCIRIIGSSCTGTGTGDCPESSNTVCVEQACACEDGYEERNNVCMHKRVSEVVCTADGGECDGITNSACDTTPAVLKCKCDPGYEEDPTDGSACVKVIGSTCSGTGPCSGDENSICVSGVCACKEGYGEKNNVCTLVVSETDCTEGECTIDNAECDEATDKCKCSPNFVMNVDTCVPENAGASKGVGALTFVLSVFTAIQLMLR